MTRRVSAGKLRLWEDALAELRLRRRDLLQLAVIFFVFLVLLNLPWWPDYEKGLLTGAFVVATLWAVAWVIWVMSGLGFRLNGVWAESATTEVCSKHRHTLSVLPSYKLERSDIDTVLVTHSAVYAVETKWRSASRWAYDPTRDAHQLKRDVAQFRAELQGLGAPDNWIRGLLVVWGPVGRGLATRLVDVGGGEQIRVVSGFELSTWLDGQSEGRIGPDWAADLVRTLRENNADRETSLEGGRLLRWLARVK